MTIRFDDSRQLLGGLSTERWHHPDIARNSLCCCRQVGSIIRRGENIPRGYSTEGVDDRVEMIGCEMVGIEIFSVRMIPVRMASVGVFSGEIV